jgi:hypothetical protein
MLGAALSVETVGNFSLGPWRVFGTIASDQVDHYPGLHLLIFLV